MAGEGFKHGGTGGGGGCAASCGGKVEVAAWGSGGRWGVAQCNGKRASGVTRELGV